MRILLATDGSEYSEGAARFLTRLHFSPQDEIIVLHVVSDIPYDDDYRAQILHVIKRVSPWIRKTAMNILGSVQARMTSLEEEGAPDETILRVAQGAGVDLIVMGAHGARGIKALVIGSVTRSVAAVSPIPVLVTKPYQVREGALKVLFATDGSPTARATEAVLGSIPFAGDTELTVMNVSPSGIGDIPERFAIEIQEQMKEYVASVRKRSSDEAARIIDGARAALKGRFATINDRVKVGDPAVEILGEAERAGADLVCVGSRGLRGMRGMLGSVSRRVMILSPCAVLIGKKRDTP